MRIVIVEDELLFRDILRKVCVSELGHEIVGEASTGKEALAVIPAASPDLVILDLNLPDSHGLEVVASLRITRALLRVLVISSHCDEYTVHRIEKAGVQGFLDKSTNTVGELRKALGAIEQNSIYFSARFLAEKAARLRNPLSFDKILTEREQTVLGLVGEPMSDEEIAGILGLSTDTVEKHRYNGMRKLGLGSRAEAGRYARKCGLTRPAVFGR